MILDWILGISALLSGASQLYGMTQKPPDMPEEEPRGMPRPGPYSPGNLVARNRQMHDQMPQFGGQQDIMSYLRKFLPPQRY